ncbi:hypothetical protein [Rhizobium leguminosarum]|uniref:hypothetical protein n=1 Tax=Rhizobium leguminosarum TaxID=384 RepID=UPI003F9E1B98
MKRWLPGDVVKPAEVIGRRIFEKNPATPLDINLVNPNHFYDSRFNEDLSLDRLGEGQPHKSTITFMTPACDAAAVEQRKSIMSQLRPEHDAASVEPSVHFVGWVAAHRKNIKHEVIRPDPLTLEREGVENPFHALLDRTDAREKVQAWRLSRSLFMSFKEHGQMVAPMRRKELVPASREID